MRNPWVLWALLLGAAGGCDGNVDPPVCGNGALEDGENATTCCRDAGCAFGTCIDDVCTEEWQTQCATAGDGGCLGGSFVCGASLEVTPSYDCSACPCSGADACYENVCTDAATREEERFSEELADNLDLDEYAAVLRHLAEDLDAVPVAEAIPILAEEVKADSRTTFLIAGADPAADIDDVDNTLRVLTDGIGITPSARVDLRDASGDDVCSELQSRGGTGGGLLPDTFVVAIVPDDTASRATCPFPGTFARCDVPVATDCALLGGRLSTTVVIIDQVATMREMDQALLIRAGITPVDVRDTFLSNAITIFQNAREVFPQQEGFRVANRFAAAFVDVAERMVWIVLSDPNARPDRTTAFRLVWNDPGSQAFMIEHDIQSRDCAFDELDGGLLLMTCDNSGFSIAATIDPGGPILVDVTTDP